MLKEVLYDNEIEEFGKYKVNLIKEHQIYANKLGLEDKVVEKYTIDDALKHVGEKNYYQFLIVHDNKNIGMLEYAIMKSEIDNENILYVNNFYIINKYRGLGIGKKIIEELKKLNYRIELECWYGMPANNFYKILGFKEIKTRYILDDNMFLKK